MDILEKKHVRDLVLRYKKYDINFEDEPCPSVFDLPTDSPCNDDCKLCWVNALKEFTFKEYC